MSKEKLNPKPASKLIENKSANFDRYEKDYSFRPSPLKSVKDVRTTAEMMAFLESEAGKDVEVDAKVLAHKPGEGFGYRKLNKSGFVESYKSNSDGRRKFREAFDDFGSGGFSGGSQNPSFGNKVGQDFTPLLGGPFYKQLYYYNDWLRMHQDCFFAMNHDPMGKATTDIITDFCLGRGFRVEWESNVMQAIWDAFEEVNDFQQMMRTFCRELSGYGEDMIWKLPNNQRYIIYPQNEINLEDVPKVFIPRIRLVDPSNIVEIVTYPEDITRVLFYVWLTPTQYQAYTGKDDKTGKVVNGTKLIYQQIPADQMMHYKINSVSNEKRGRSDLFAALPYFKRLRDCVNYEIIGQQKNAAWAIDTEVQGDENDINNYMAAQQALGTIPSAGSEFVHTAAIKRQYLGNSGTGKSLSSAFEWTASLASMATRIPLSYYGTHLSGGTTRASALVATEPVAKMFEMRQEVLKRTIGDIAKWASSCFGIKSEFEVHMPEIITQDRSAKIKDIYMAEQAGWISPERAAETTAAEFGFRDYDFEAEQEKIKSQKADEPALMIPGASPLTAVPAAPTDAPKAGSSSAVTGEEKKRISDNGGA